MGWRRIDSPLVRSTISCPGRSADTLRRYTAGPGHKMAKTTPCKVEWAPARSTLAACVRGTRWSVVTAQPDLILLQVAAFAVSQSFDRNAAGLTLCSSHASSTEWKVAIGQPTQRILKRGRRLSPTVIDASPRQPSDPPWALHPFSCNDLNPVVTNPRWPRANSRTVAFVDR